MQVEVNIIRDEDAKEKNRHVFGWLIHMYIEKIQNDGRTWDKEETMWGNRDLKRDMWKDICHLQ